MSKWKASKGLSGIFCYQPPYLYLLAAGILEFLFIVLESQFSYLGYYLAETYLIVPCLLFLSHILQRKLSVFSKRRLLLALAAIIWFVITQILHRLFGMGNHTITTVFFVYLMAFPFASLSDDYDNTGLKWIGRIFISAALVLVVYSVILLLDCVPASLEKYIFWDGARLHVLWHPNIAACYFMIGIGFSAAFFTQAKNIHAKIFLLVAIVLQLLAMALTNCRTTILLTGAFFASILFFVISKRIKIAPSGQKIKKWIVIFACIVIIPLILIGLFKLSNQLYHSNNDRLSDTLQESADSTENDTLELDKNGTILGDNGQGSLQNDMRTLNGRTEIWRSALCAVRDNRALALWGTEYSGTVISSYNRFPVVHAHNSWIEALLRLGIPGLLISLVFTVLSLWSAARLILNHDTPLWKQIIAMLTICVMATGFLEPYLFITNVYYHIIDFAFFFLTGYLDYWCQSEKS